MTKWLCALTVALIAGPVWADLPVPPGGRRPDRTRQFLPPPPPPATTAPLLIEASDSVTEARLKIPRKLLGQLRAAADNETNDAAGPGIRTIGAGIGLSLSLAASGLWLVRCRGRFRAGSLLLLGALMLPAVGGAVLWASPPPPGRPPTPIIAVPPVGEKVTVEVVDEGNAIQLIVPRATLTRMADKTQAPAEPKK